MDDPLLRPLRDCSDAVAGACAELADQLAQQCFRGDGAACDILFSIAAAGSAHETYGATCGGRLAGVHAGSCASFLAPVPPAGPS